MFYLYLFCDYDEHITVELSIFNERVHELIDRIYGNGTVQLVVHGRSVIQTHIFSQEQFVYFLQERKDQKVPFATRFDHEACQELISILKK